eukprot:14223154-Alexandrium_andersonii.AAC.1
MSASLVGSEMCIRDRTYVDDLSAHVRGAAQALVLAYFLVAASDIAGLLVETHHCGGVVITHGERA